MSGYKLYVLAQTGRIEKAAEVVEANSDTEALAVARSIELSKHSELWHGSRLVARIAPKRLTVPPAQRPANEGQ